MRRTVRPSLLLARRALLGWLAAAVVLTIAACGPGMPELTNPPTGPFETVSGLIDVRSSLFRGTAHAAVVVQAPGRLRLEVLSAKGAEAVVILSPEAASCSFPSDRVVHESTPQSLTRDLLGVELNAIELVDILMGRTAGLEGWVRSGPTLQRDQATITFARVLEASRLPWLIDFTGQENRRARIHWKQMTFDRDPPASAFDPPAGYAPCNREDFLKRLGLRSA